MFLLTVILMMTLAGAEVDLFVPSFPQLQDVFDCSTFVIELTLSLNLVAHCITALFVGTLGDKCGRKPIIVIGLLIFIIGSLFCLFATDFYILIFGRVLQGIGISGPAVLTCVIISDIYSAKKMQTLMGMVNASVTIAMAFAPVVGSYVNLFFNWQGNFFILLIFGVIVLFLVLFFIPETHSDHPENPIKTSLKSYLPIFQSQKANLYLISICFAMQAYWVFIGMSPILYMEDLRVSIEDFGLYQGAIAAFFSIASLTTGRFIKKFGVYNCFIFSCYLILIFFLMINIITIFNIKNPLIITIAMLFQAVGMAYPVNIFWPLALNAVRNAKARIGALLDSFRLILSAISIGIASYFYNGSFLTIGLTISITLTISAVSCYILFYKYEILEDSKLVA